MLDYSSARPNLEQLKENRTLLFYVSFSRFQMEDAGFQ